MLHHAKAPACRGFVVGTTEIQLELVRNQPVFLLSPEPRLYRLPYAASRRVSQHPGSGGLIGRELLGRRSLGLAYHILEKQRSRMFLLAFGGFSESPTAPSSVEA